MLSQFYFSAVHHPLWCWVSVFFTLGAVLGVLRSAPQFKHPFVKTFLILFSVEIFLDALCTGHLTPFPEGGVVEQNIGIVFVILGDWRYFVLLAFGFALVRGESDSSLSLRGWGGAFGCALVLPILSGLGTKVAPELFADVRVVYLAYELVFMSLALVLAAFILPSRLASLDAETRRLFIAISWFEVVQYGLWSYADIVILDQGEIGFAFRLIPNALYYAAFLPMVYYWAPRRHGVV